MPAQRIDTLFLDVGGVLLTNGWGRDSRALAAERFGLDLQELNERHNLTFDTYELGKLTLDEYLQRTVFCRPRDFSPQQFKEFMYVQSQPLPEMLDWVREVKQRHNLRVAAVSNEGRELTDHRIARFDLQSVFDVFVFSSYVGMRKPDEGIYKFALDLTQSAPERTLYLDDRAMFVEIASGLGIHSICHQGIDQTRARMAELGLTF